MGANKQGIIRKAFNVLTLAQTMTIGLLVAAAGMVGTAEGEFVFSTKCQAQWCENDRSNAFIAAEGKQMIAEQVAAHGCDTRQRLAPNVAILKSEKAGRVETIKGTYTGDLAVVRVVPFDTAWELAQRGDAWVVGYCG